MISKSLAYWILPMVLGLTTWGCTVSPGADPTSTAMKPSDENTYLRPGDFKFPPIRGHDGLVTGPLSIDEILDLSAAGRSPIWNHGTSTITYSRGGRLWSMDSAGGSQTPLDVEPGESGFFLTPQHLNHSPDGHWLSWISSRSGTPELWIWSEAEGGARQLTDLGSDEVNAYSWSPDGAWIAFSANRHGSFDIWKVGVPSGEVHRLTAHPLYEVYPTWTPDGDILYVRLDDRWVDHDIISISAEGKDPRILVRDFDFFDYGYGRTFGFPLIAPDGQRVAFRSHRSGWINYWSTPLGGGEPRPLAAQEADQSEGTWSPDGQWFAYASNTNGTHDLRIVSPDGGEPRILVAPERGIVSSPGWSPDGSSIVYTLETPNQPAEIQSVRVGEGTVLTLVPANIDPHHASHLVEPEKIHYQSTDGLVIPAYLYRPAESGPNDRLPGVLWIHGGPTSQWHDSFHNDVQFFVQQGFVILMPNIRGSSGYGKPFEQLNDACWGHCDLEDVVAGVEYLKTLSYLDPENIGIYGSSYGGIMSMAAPAFAPGVFQAAIPHGGYGDWIDFHHGHNELRHIKLLEYEFGTFNENEATWRRSSPIYAVQDITTPMFLVHGAGRYPTYSQTYDFARALQRHQKTFRYNVYSGENYYVSGRENRRQLWLDMLAFLNQHLKDNVSSAGIGHR